MDIHLQRNRSSKRNILVLTAQSDFEDTFLLYVETALVSGKAEDWGQVIRMWTGPVDAEIFEDNTKRSDEAAA